MRDATVVQATRALQGTQFASLARLITTTPMLLYSSDLKSAAQIAFDCQKASPKFCVVAASVDGVLLDAEGLQAYLALPPIDEIRAAIPQMLAAHISRVTSTLSAPVSKLHQTLSTSPKAVAGLLHAVKHSKEQQKPAA